MLRIGMRRVFAAGALWAAFASCSSANDAEQQKIRFVQPLRGVLAEAQREAVPDRERGGWLFEPVLRASVEFDDNVFAAPVLPEEDTIFLLRPSVRLLRDEKDYDIAFDAFYQYQTFADDTNDDVNEGGASLAGRVAVGGGGRVNARVSYLRNVEDRADPDDVNNERAKDDRMTALLGYAGEWGRVGFNTSVEARRFDYLTADDQDRDRDDLAASARLRYAATSGFTPFIRFDYADLDFDDALDDGGVNRDLTRATIWGGASMRWDDMLSIEAALGSSRSSFDQATFRDLTTFVADVDVVWRWSERTSLIAGINRSVNTTTESGASARIRTSYLLRLDHKIVDDVVLFGWANFANDEFEQDPREDDYTFYSVGAEWFATETFRFFADYRYSERSSNDPTEEYERNAFRVGTRIRF